MGGWLVSYYKMGDFSNSNRIQRRCHFMIGAVRHTVPSAAKGFVEPAKCML